MDLAAGKFRKYCTSVLDDLTFLAGKSGNIAIAGCGLTFGEFGSYTNTMSIPRVMQFSLRYDF